MSHYYTKRARNRSLIASATIALAVIGYLAFTFFEIALIPTRSMEPTVYVGDHLLVAKFLDGPKLPLTKSRLPRIASPHRGEVISFHAPNSPELVFLKRVVAIGGDRVEIRDGVLCVNGEAVQERYTAPHAATKMHELTVPANHIFVLGDNRDNSEDSRFFGPVSVDSVVGRPQMVVWSVRGKTSDWLSLNDTVRKRFYLTVAEHLFASTRWARTGLSLRLSR